MALHVRVVDVALENRMQPLYREMGLVNPEKEEVEAQHTPRLVTFVTSGWRGGAAEHPLGICALGYALPGRPGTRADPQECVRSVLVIRDGVTGTDKESHRVQGDTHIMKKRLFRLIALVALLGVGLFAIATPIAHAAPPTSHTITRMSSTIAFAGFSFMQGDHTDNVSVAVSANGFQAPTPISGPAVRAEVVECILTGENAECTSFVGFAPASGFQMNKQLASATLPEVTVPVSPADYYGNPSGPPVFEVTVALTWTGVGAITRQSDVSHTRIGHTYIETFHGKGTFRNATVSGSVSYPSPFFGPITLTGANSDFAIMMSQSSMDISIQR
jgi:hypothetical protein